MPKSFSELNKEDNKIAQLGWPDLQILSGKKIGKIIQLETSKGMMTISSSELFYQNLLRLRIFENFNLLVAKVKASEYEEWLAQWTLIIQEVQETELSTSEIIRGSLFEFFDTAPEKEDYSYLKKSLPIYKEEENSAYYLFRAMDFLIWLKKNKHIQMNPQNLFFHLQVIGCTQDRVGTERIRCWKKEIEHKSIKNSLFSNESTDKKD